ncbi:hypothetical protein BXY75_2595 [Ulvibacter antarcticus]|uniref:Uncharacterized protein n=1 Tax=Ulvibacter antarcticus TaxID=442714 RepID=A0A3L9YED6_9FLAO|nr:hypothetical protein BXY75_2595 [Ulvibacter antarcticus]
MNTDNLYNIVNVLEFIAAIAATVYFNKYKHSSEKHFLYFLWLTFIIEIIGVICIYNGIAVEWFYQIFMIISFLFYFYWYHNILRKRIFRKTVYLVSGLFIILSILAYILPESFGNRAYAFIAGSIGLLVLTMFHFYQLLNSDEVLIVKYKLSFWISIGLLLFYLGMVPLAQLSKYLNTGALSRMIILLSLNCILYGCYIIGFLWTKKKYNHF